MDDWTLMSVRSRWRRKRHRAGKLATRSVDGSSVLYTSAPTMAAYFRRRAGACSGGGPLADEPYPALLVAGSAATPGDTGGDAAVVAGCDLEKVYEFSTTAAAAPDYESRDDDVIDCCPRHYQMALVDAQRLQPSLETFRPSGDTVTAAAGGMQGECCPLMTAQQRYGAAAAAVLRLHDRRR